MRALGKSAALRVWSGWWWDKITSVMRSGEPIRRWSGIRMAAVSGTIPGSTTTRTSPSSTKLTVLATRSPAYPVKSTRNSAAMPRPDFRSGQIAPDLGRSGSKARSSRLVTFAGDSAPALPNALGCHFHDQCDRDLLAMLAPLGRVSAWDRNGPPVARTLVDRAGNLWALLRGGRDGGADVRVPRARGVPRPSLPLGRRHPVVRCGVPGAIPDPNPGAVRA